MERQEIENIINQVSNRTISTDEAIEEIVRLTSISYQERIMVNFEYTSKDLSSTEYSHEREERMLDNMNDNGWELVSVLGFKTYIKYYFKRQKL